MKFYIIEDYAPYVRSLAKVLTDAGHEVRSMTQFDALETCVKTIVDENPDVVLLDHALCSSFGGAEVFRALRERNVSFRIVSIATSRQEYCPDRFDGKSTVLLSPESLLNMFT